MSVKSHTDSVSPGPDSRTFFYGVQPNEHTPEPELMSRNLLAKINEELSMVNDSKKRGFLKNYIGRTKDTHEQIQILKNHLQNLKKLHENLTADIDVQREKNSQINDKQPRLFKMVKDYQLELLENSEKLQKKLEEDIQKIEHLLQYIDDILKHRGGGTKRNHRKSMHKRKSNKKSRKHR